MNSLIHSLNHLGAHLTGFAFSMLVQSSLLIVALFLLDLALRTKVRAVVRYPLWLLVLVKLILPPSLAAPTAPAYWLPERTIAKPSLASTPRPLVHYTETGIVEPPFLQTMPPPPPRPRLEVAAKLLLAWLAIALCLMAWLVRRSHSVARTAARATPASSSPKEWLQVCRKQMGIRRRVGVKISANTGSPAVCGLGQPVILIPQALADKLTPLQMRAVLFHELAHIQRGDVWVNYAQTLLQIFYWWHPLLWLANAHIRRVREQAVDERVMVEMGGEADAYPNTLIEVAKLASRRPMPALGLIGIVESKSALAQRIRHLLDSPTPRSAKLGFARLAAVALLGAALLPMARGQRKQVAQVAAPTPQSLSQSTAIEVDVKFVSLTQAAFESLLGFRPKTIAANGHCVWTVSPADQDELLQRMDQQPDVVILSAPRMTTTHARQAQMAVDGIQPFLHPRAHTSAAFQIVPYQMGGSLDLAVSAKITETGDVDSVFGDDLSRNNLKEDTDDTRPNAKSNQVYAVNAVGYINYDVGTAQTLVGEGEAVILQNPALTGANGRRILVIVSPRVVRQSASVMEPNTNAIPVAAAPGASNQLRETMDARRTSFSNSLKSQPTNTLTRSEGSGATKRFASAAGQEVEIKGAEIRYDPQTGICVVINDFVLRFNGAVLTARQGQVNSRTGDVVVEGDVTLQRGDQVLRAERLQYNYIDQKITDAAPSNWDPVLGDLPFVGRLFRPDAGADRPARQAIPAGPNPEPRMDSGVESASKTSDESPAALVNRVFQVDPKTFYEDVHRFLLDRGWSDIEIFGHSNEWKTSLLQKFCESLGLNRVPPNAFFYSDSGMLMVRATADKLDRVQQAIETLNLLRPKDAPPKLETRVFRVHPQTFLEPLRAPLKSGTIGAKIDEVVSSIRDPQVRTSTAQQVVRDFFTAAGVSVQPPNAFFFNDRTGMLMVRATAQELEIVQKALEPLNDRPPPQITLEARFIEMPTETASQLGLDLPPPDAASETWTRILTAAQARTVLRKAEQLQGVTILSAPKVTTLSGRQTQIQVSDVNSIAKSRAEGLTPPSPQSNARVTARPELTSEAQPGVTLDVLPLVDADGYTIRLSALSQATELLRYDNTPDGVIKAGLKAAGRNREARLSLSVIRALILFTRRMQAAIDVYDSQTLVLGKPKVTFTVQQADSEPVSFAFPEDTGKRLLVFITPTLIDPAGNPIHASGNAPWADKTPPQTR